MPQHVLRGIDRDVLHRAKEQTREQEGDQGRRFDDILMILIEMYADGEIHVPLEKRPARDGNR